MVIKELDNGWDAEKAYSLTLVQAINEKRKYIEEWDSLSAEQQIQWAVITAKMEIIETFERVR